MRRFRLWLVCMLMHSLLSFASHGGGIALVNAGFEMPKDIGSQLPGWISLGDGYTIGLDEDAFDGRHSAKISKSGAGNFGAFTQKVSAIPMHGKVLELSAQVKVKVGSTGGAGLWIQVLKDRTVLAFDNMEERKVIGSDMWARARLRFFVPTTATSITVGGMMFGEGDAWFDDFSLMEVGEIADSNGSSIAYLESALKIVEMNSVMVSKLEWSSIRKKALQLPVSFNSPPDTYNAIRFALASLNDGHSFFLPPKVEGTDRAIAAKELFRTAQLESKVGYFSLFGFPGTKSKLMQEYGVEFDRRFDRFAKAGTCKWIIDLRENRGGNMWPMVGALSRLFGDGTIGGFEYGNGKKAEWKIEGEHVFLGNFPQATAFRQSHLEKPHTKDPVAVLIGAATASSGEAIAVSFIGRKHTILIGQATAGKTTGNRPFKLQDGASLVLAESFFLDRNGQAYYDKLSPELFVSTSNYPNGSVQDPGLIAAMRWLDSQACRV